MKLTLATAVALLGAGLFSLLDPADPETLGPAAAPTVGIATPPAPSTAAAPTPGAPGSEVADPAAPTRATAVATAAQRRAPADPEAAPGADLDLFGHVLDERGRPLDGALVYLVRRPQSERDAVGARTWEPAVGPAPIGIAQVTPGRSPLAPVRTGPDGAFRFGAAVLASVEGAGPLELGVHKNGYVRRVVADPLADRPEGGLELVLARGPLLAGRIVDESGRPVPDLSLIATAGDVGFDDVSPTVARERADARRMADSTSAYHECRVTTGAGGDFVLSGLPSGAVRLATFDPGWRIADADPVPLDAGLATWTARRCLGARVELVAPGLAVESVSATFRARLEFADGATKDFGPWLGRGPGVVELRLDDRAVPELAGGARRVVAATFRGTLTLGALTAEWEAPPIVGVERAAGVATVRVPFERLAAELAGFAEAQAARAPAMASTAADATFRIQARYTDGAPLDRPLALSWTSTDEEGQARSGAGVLSPDAEGSLELEVTPGSVRLDVRPKGGSGSLPSWVDTLACAPGATLDVAVTLERGGTAELTRPDGWPRLWYVQGSYRTSSDEAWTGSWDYLALDAVHTLTALRPAEWRFRLRRTKDGPPEYEHLVRVREGETVAVP